MARTSIASTLRWALAGRSASAAVVNTLGSKVLLLGLNVLTGVIAARSLGPAGRGESIAVALWPAIVQAALTFGIPVALTYHARRSPQERDDLFSTAIVIGSVTGCVAAAVGAFVVVPIMLHAYTPYAIHFAQWMMLFAPQIMIFNLFNSLLDVRGEFARSNFFWLFGSAATLALQLALLAAHDFTPYTNGLAYFAPSLLTTIYLGVHVRRSFVWRSGFRGRAKRLLHYGVRVYGLDLLNTLSGQIDQTLVVGLLSAGSFGIYTTSVNVTRMLNTVQTSINVVLFPKAAGLEPDRAVTLIERAARVSLLATVCCAIGFAAVIPLVIPLFYGAAFAAAIPITRILTIEAVVQGSLAVLSQAFMATGRPGLITTLQVCGLLTSLPLMLFLIPRAGLAGAAYALLGASIVRGVLLLVCFPLVLKRPVPMLLTTAGDVREAVGRLRRAA